MKSGSACGVNCQMKREYFYAFENTGRGLFETPKVCRHFLSFFSLCFLRQQDLVCHDLIPLLSKHGFKHADGRTLACSCSEVKSLVFGSTSCLTRPHNDISPPSPMTAKSTLLCSIIYRVTNNPLADHLSRRYPPPQAR